MRAFKREKRLAGQMAKLLHVVSAGTALAANCYYHELLLTQPSFRGLLPRFVAGGFAVCQAH